MLLYLSTLVLLNILRIDYQQLLDSLNPVVGAGTLDAADKR